ncbi:MAG: phytanoyl-CoA dioxygenase family protein [Alphaproteobacteria bacterium]
MQTQIHAEELSLSEPRLGEQHLADYRSQGFVVLPQAFGPAEMDRIDRWTDELLAMPEEPGRHWVYWEKSLRDPGRKIVSRIENISPFHPGFKVLTESLKGICAQLFGEPAILFKEKVNFKMPGGDGFKPHQDSQAGWERYASDFISVLLCIDDATVANGCLQIVAGHHTRGLYRAWEPLTEADMASMKFEPVPTKRGDIILFDSYTPHASDPNMTDQVRRIYFATYNRLSEGDRLAAYYADKHKNYPPDIERESGKEYVFRV